MKNPTFLLFFLIIILSSGSSSVSSQSEEQPITFSTLMNQLVDLDRIFLKPEYTIGMFSSYDRQGGNRDGNGYLFKEDDRYVIAEMEGPGAITRIWSSNPKGTIRIYLDGEEKPRMERAFRNIFSNSRKPFVKPFVYHSSQTTGPSWSYIPIPYETSCKITLDEICYYQIDYITYPKDQRVRSLEYPITQTDSIKLTDTGKQFQISENPPFFSSDEIKEHNVKLTIPAGETLDIANLEGPGIIKGMLMKWPDSHPEIGRELLLWGFWDQEKYPSILAPVSDFFADRVRSLALGQYKDGWRYCYFPMPFLTHAQLKLTNSHETQSREIDLRLFVQEQANLPHPLRCFHAYWERDNDTTIKEVKRLKSTIEPVVDVKDNYSALFVQGSGHVVGIYMLRTPSPQSDTMVFIDQIDDIPDLPGTGRSGFYDQGGRVLTTNWPLAAGVSDFQSLNGLLRLFLPSIMQFDNGIYFSCEHGNANMLRKDIATTTYWYQEEPHERFSWPLPSKGRHYRTTSTTQPIYIFDQEKGVPQRPIEAEDYVVTTNGGIFDPQDMRPYGPDWSNNQQLRLEAFGEGASFRMELPPREYSGYYDFVAQLTQSPEGAQMELRIDSKTIFPSIDLYDENTSHRRIVSSQPIFLHASSPIQLSISIKGKSSDSEGLVVGLDSFEFKPVKYTPPTLAVEGPFELNPADQEDYEPHTVSTKDGEKLLLGYSNKENDFPKKETLSPNEDGSFDLGLLLKSTGVEEGVCWVTMKVKAQKTGIYAMEMIPSSSPPFLLESDSDRINPINHSVLWDGIYLQGEEKYRYDPVKQQLLPQRYRIPLNPKECQISWLVKCDQDTTITPFIYGLSEDLP